MEYEAWIWRHCEHADTPRDNRTIFILLSRWSKTPGNNNRACSQCLHTHASYSIPVLSPFLFLTSLYAFLFIVFYLYKMQAFVCMHGNRCPLPTLSRDNGWRVRWERKWVGICCSVDNGIWGDRAHERAVFCGQRICLLIETPLK